MGQIGKGIGKHRDIKLVHEMHADGRMIENQGKCHNNGRHEGRAADREGQQLTNWPN
ncbi:MAG: hypothetical protein V2B20_14490 [Pseudomonadota bacterium]